MFISKLDMKLQSYKQKTTTLSHPLAFYIHTRITYLQTTSKVTKAWQLFLFFR